MDIKINGNEVIFDGLLSEAFPKDLFVSTSANVLKTHDSVTVNFDKVRRANSCGLALFLKALAEINHTIVLSQCPTWLVEQFNEIFEFFDYAVVKSVYAPYLSQEDGSYEAFIVEITEDFFNSKAFEDVEKRVDENGKTWNADFDKSEYFNFLNFIKK